MPLSAGMAGANVGGGAENDYGDYGDEGEEDPSVGGGMPAGANPFAALAQNPNFGLIRQRIL